MMSIEAFFDKLTATITYLVTDLTTQRCAIIDSLADYDQFSGELVYRSADQLIQHIKQNQLSVEWILETHIHADHLTAAKYLKSHLGGKLSIGSHIKDVLHYWIPLYNSSQDTKNDGSQFDKLFDDGEQFNIGTLTVKVIHTPGHTPACVSYWIEDALFVGDALFMPYVGTARTDFPGGSAETLYDSLQKILSLPKSTRIFSCHDYPKEGDQPAWGLTIEEQIKQNPMLDPGWSREHFVEVRNQRDHHKPVPKLLLPSIQFNMRCGDAGSFENGRQYIKIPINPFKS